MDERRSGWVYGFIGMAIFSGSLGATRVGVGQFDPIFFTAARAVIAGLVGCMLLMLFAKSAPKRHDLISLVLVAIGAVVGFPLLTALALQHITSAHSAVFIGLLPLSTAIFGVIRAGDRPRPAFWLFSILGSVFVIGFALTTDFKSSLFGDVLMLVAIVVCGLGYAEGAKLSRKLGGWQVICWALLLSMPVTVPLAFYSAPTTLIGVGVPAWLALGYVSLFSMLIGFVFWYRGLAQGGIAAVGQLQLLQPFLGLVLAGFLLQEKVSPSMIVVSAGVVLCVAGAKRFA